MNCEACQLKELVLEPLEIREVLRCILHTIVFHRALGLVRPKDVDCELFEITYVQCGDSELEKKVEEKIDQFMGWVEKHPNRKSQVSLSFYEVKNKQQTWFSNKTERLYWEQWHINLHVVTPKTHGRSHHSKAPSVPRENELEESSCRRAALESSLRDVLFQIVRFVNDKKDHIPSISNPEVISFPYEITIPRFVLPFLYQPPLSRRTPALPISSLLEHIYFVKELQYESPGDTFSLGVFHSSSDSSFGWHADVFKRMLQTGHPTMLS